MLLRVLSTEVLVSTNTYEVLYHILQIKADVQYGGFHSNHENNIAKEEWGSDILLLVSF